jgi:plastocyanin domain-containing protein
VEVETNAEGVQEVVLVVTPGGYTPLRFAVKKGVPVRLIFRSLGQVGCGNELNFPTGGGGMAALTLSSPSDQQVLEFTPQETGAFEFFCGHLMYRGVMTVHD